MKNSLICGILCLLILQGCSKSNNANSEFVKGSIVSVKLDLVHGKRNVCRSDKLILTVLLENHTKDTFLVKRDVVTPCDFYKSSDQRHVMRFDTSNVSLDRIKLLHHSGLVGLSLFDSLALIKIPPDNSCTVNYFVQGRLKGGTPRNIAELYYDLLNSDYKLTSVMGQENKVYNFEKGEGLTPLVYLDDELENWDSIKTHVINGIIERSMIKDNKAR
ncbi:MAG: hypothetical protein JJ975_12700 [Bacteroidia bacterium]|nr:hypothetical protein [Bacteroidia bacterium]